MTTAATPISTMLLQHPGLVLPNRALLKLYIKSSCSVVVLHSSHALTPRYFPNTLDVPTRETSSIRCLLIQ